MMGVVQLFAASLLAVALANPKPPENYLLAGCQQTNSKTLNCEALQISNVPTDIPASIERLLLKNNIINDNTGTELARCLSSTDPCGSGALQADNLVHLPSTVTEIQLQGNGIISVADNAFVAVGANLEVLRLFGNELIEIQANALAGLTSLTTLYINNNANLMAIRSGAFAAFASTLSELFAKDNDALTVIEDNTVNALTFRPIFIDMTTTSGSLCAISPPKFVNGSLVDGAITCACAANAGLTGGDEGFCVASSAPTPAPTTASPTPQPTTAAPTTRAPTTAAPTTAAPTTAAPTTVAPTTAAPTTATPTTVDQNREPDTTPAAKLVVTEQAPRGMGGKSGKSGMGETGVFGDEQNRDVGGQSSGGKKGKSENGNSALDRTGGGGGKSGKSENGFGYSEKGGKSGKTSRVGKMSLDNTIGFQPIGDQTANVNLNGAKPAKWGVYGAVGAVVLAVGAILITFGRKKDNARFQKLPLNMPDRSPKNDYATITQSEATLEM